MSCQTFPNLASGRLRININMTKRILTSVGYFTTKYFTACINSSELGWLAFYNIPSQSCPTLPITLNLWASVSFSLLIPVRKFVLYISTQEPTSSTFQCQDYYLTYMWLCYKKVYWGGSFQHSANMQSPHRKVDRFEPRNIHEQRLKYQPITSKAQ